jgi:hypothetical protein
MPPEPTGGIAAYGHRLQFFHAHNIHQLTHEFSGRPLAAQLLRGENVIYVKRVLVLTDIGVNHQVAKRHFITFFRLIYRLLDCLQS